MEGLFDIEYWLPFNGGQYHCTIAVGVTQEYVDKVKTQYEKDLHRWQTGPHFLPFFHSLNIVPHIFMPNHSSFQKSEVHNKEIAKVREEARKEGKKTALREAKHFITNQTKLKEFEKYIETL